MTKITDKELLEFFERIHDAFEEPDEGIWKRTPEESDQQYFGFLCYLDLGSARTYRDAWHLYREGFEKSPMSSTFRIWAKTFNWAERAEAYDEYILSMRRKATEAMAMQAQIYIGNASLDVAKKLVEAALYGDATTSQIQAIKHALGIAGLQPTKHSLIKHEVDTSALDELLGLDSPESEDK